MSRTFFTDRIASHGIEVIVPDAEKHDRINSVIYDELVHGRVLDPSRRRMVELIDGLWDRGAQGVILGCTELELPVAQAHFEVPLFPCSTFTVHAAAAAALGWPLGPGRGGRT